MRSIRPIVALVCSLSCLSALAQSTNQSHASDRVKQEANAKQSVTLKIDVSLLGSDSDGDGIRDDIEAIVAKTAQEAAVEPKAPPTAMATPTEEGALATIMPKARTSKRQPPRPGCFDYLLLSPKDRHEADLRTRQRTNSMPGTHPCDAVMSPLLERPYETDYVEIGPVILRQ